MTAASPRVGAARLSVCDVSLRAAGIEAGNVGGLSDKDFVTQWRNAERVERCDRYLVFSEEIDMGKRVAVITKDKDRQFEALRTGLGLLLEQHNVICSSSITRLNVTSATSTTSDSSTRWAATVTATSPGHFEQHGFRPV